MLNWFKALPGIAKWLIAGALAVLLLLLVVYGKDSVGNWWEKRLEAKYDKKITEKEAQINKLKVENEKLVTESKEAIAKAQMKEQEAELLKAELEKYGKAAREAVAKQEEASKNYEDDKARIDRDATAFDRCQSLCAERREVGYPCPPKFCDQYAGR